MTKFDSFGFEDSLLDGLTSMGFEKATPIQEKAIPLILENNDLIACAQTGTGKTAAFLLPVIDKICKKQSADISVNTVIIAPTRELALQIDQQVEALAYFTGVVSAPIYGGTDAGEFDKQKNALKNGADIIIGTPGKLLAHLRFGYAKLDQMEHLILDEADRMLDMGFYEDILNIIEYFPKERQTLLFSATMPDKIRKLAKKTLQNPKEVNIAISKPAAGVMQAAYNVYDDQKIALVSSLLKGKDNYKSIIIFASTKLSCKNLSRQLKKEKFSVDEIHSDLDQSEREVVLRDFKNRKLQILVATDILSRGIDIDSISLVINYDVPNDAEDYVHRVGRTARAENTGLALTFINPRDQQKFGKIEALIEREIPKLNLPEGFKQGPKYDPNRRPSSGSKYRGKKKNFSNNKKGGKRYNKPKKKD